MNPTNSKLSEGCAEPERAIHSAAAATMSAEAHPSTFNMEKQQARLNQLFRKYPDSSDVSLLRRAISQYRLEQP